jgi:hypothetical protein
MLPSRMFARPNPLRAPTRTTSGPPQPGLIFSPLNVERSTLNRRSLSPLFAQILQTAVPNSFACTHFQKTPGRWRGWGPVQSTPHETRRSPVPSDESPIRHSTPAATPVPSMACAQFPSPRGGGASHESPVTSLYSLLTVHYSRHPHKSSGENCAKASGAASSKRVRRLRKTNLTLSVGPLRCLAMRSSVSSRSSGVAPALKKCGR